MKKIKYLLLLSALLTLIGCGKNEIAENAAQVIEAYMDDRKQNGLKASEKYYSKLFMDATSNGQWDEMENTVEKAHGRLVSYVQNNWQVDQPPGGQGLKGTFVLISYNTTYERGSGVEFFTLHRETEADEFKILRHNFDSKAIREIVSQNMKKKPQAES